MLIDSNDLPDGSHVECDICIAGSGPAGITIASELEGTQMRVCLIESGGLSKQRTDQVSSVAEQVGVPMDVGKLREPAFGGASNRWGGLAGRWFRTKPLDPVDFQVRPWVPNSGWPFEPEALAPCLERARRTLNLPSLEGFGAAAHIEQCAPEFHNEDLETTIFQMTKPVRFGKQFRALLAGSRNVRVFLNGRVIEIEECPSSPLARCFRVASPGGKTLRVSAKHFVLACGGIENARLLLASKGKASSGIGNGHDLVGRYYMQHPKGRHGIVLFNRTFSCSPLYCQSHIKNGIKIVGGLSFSADFQRRERVLNHSLLFYPILFLSESPVSEAGSVSER